MPGNVSACPCSRSSTACEGARLDISDLRIPSVCMSRDRASLPLSPSIHPPPNSSHHHFHFHSHSVTTTHGTSAQLRHRGPRLAHLPHLRPRGPQHHRCACGLAAMPCLVCSILPRRPQFLPKAGVPSFHFPKLGLCVFDDVRAWRAALLATRPHREPRVICDGACAAKEP